MTENNKQYLTVCFISSTPVGERTMRIMPEDVPACLSNEGIMHQANEALRLAGIDVRICGLVEDDNHKWKTEII